MTSNQRSFGSPNRSHGSAGSGSLQQVEVTLNDNNFVSGQFNLIKDTPIDLTKATPYFDSAGDSKLALSPHREAKLRAQLNVVA